MSALPDSDYLRYLAEARRVAASVDYYARGHSLRRDEIMAHMAALERECLIALNLPLCHALLTAPPSALTSTAVPKAGEPIKLAKKRATTATELRNTQMALAFDSGG